MQMREKSHVVKPLLGLMRPYTLQILLCVVLVMLFTWLLAKFERRLAQSDR